MLDALAGVLEVWPRMIGGYRDGESRYDGYATCTCWRKT